MNVSPFAPALEVMKVMKGFNRPWFVAGGWAIDLFLGRVTRHHKDIEIVVLRKDQLHVRRHFSAWDLEKVVPRRDKRIEEWREDEWLELPIHEIHASRKQGDPRSIEILLNESSGDLWRFRRNPDVIMPLADIGKMTVEGVPFLCPEIVLLYKAKDPKAEDSADFTLLRPLMNYESRRWLARAIQMCHGRHAWLDDL